MTATTALLLADEMLTQMANDMRFNLVVGACAILSFALGLALGWRTQVEGERFLVAIFRPLASVNSTSLRGWARLALLFLWLALVLSHFTLSG